jgi:hemerythrin superfamily protein
MLHHHTRIERGAPTELLHRDHRRIRELLREYDTLPLENRDRREWLFREIQRLLMFHFALEEDVLFPAVQSMGTKRAMGSVEEARWNHRLVRDLLNEMDLLDPRDLTFDSKMETLRVCLEQYAVTEERALFGQVRSMSRELREALRTRLEQRQEQLLEAEQHP